jgi:Antibiotic biosynthesis monooxygenase
MPGVPWPAERGGLLVAVASCDDVEMILEQAHLDVIPGQEAAFEAAFAEAKLVISAMPGFRSLRLSRCVSDPTGTSYSWSGAGSRTTPRGSDARRNTSPGVPCFITSMTRFQSLSITKTLRVSAVVDGACVERASRPRRRTGRRSDGSVRRTARPLRTP